MTTILVTGATGNVGRPLVTDLVDAGVTVRAVTRHPGSASLPAAAQLVTAAADGLRGADAVFLNSRALGDDLETVVDRARSEG